MSVQPKILTIVIACDDIARTYTTLRSVQQMRYRNHEIICLVPNSSVNILRNLKTDFNWVTLICDKNRPFSDLIKVVVEHARYSFIEAILFVQAGSTLENDFVNQIVRHFNRYQNIDLFFPTIVRPDEKGTVYGGVSVGPWPHQMRSVTDQSNLLIDPERLHFLGPVCFARTKACFKNIITNADDELALFYWVERMMSAGVKSYVTLDLSVFFDGVIYSDLSDAMIVPKSWYGDLERYISTYGTWYDKVVFWTRYRWRREGSFIARFIDGWWQSQTVYKTPED